MAGFRRLPFRTYWAVFSDVVESLNQRNLGLIAAGVAFYSMLATFPGIAAVVTIWGLVADPAIVDEELARIRPFLPEQVYGIIDRQVNSLVTGSEAKATLATAASLLLSLFLARAGTDGLVRGLNASYYASNRGGFRQVLTAVWLTIALVGVGLLLLACVVIMPLVLKFLPLGPLAELFAEATRWTITFGAMTFGLSVVYRYGPNLRGRRPGWITSGGVLALALWIAASVAFSFYLSNYGRYDEIYGALGTVVALLMWFYISAFIVLLGAVLNAEIYRWRTGRRRADEPVVPSEDADLAALAHGDAKPSGDG